MERRRLRSDLIEVYKIPRTMDKVNCLCFSVVEDSKTRGPRLKLREERFRMDLRSNLLHSKFVALFFQLNAWLMDLCLDPFNDPLIVYSMLYKITAPNH